MRPLFLHSNSRSGQEFVTVYFWRLQKSPTVCRGRRSRGATGKEPELSRGRVQTIIPLKIGKARLRRQTQAIRLSSGQLQIGLECSVANQGRLVPLDCQA